MDDFVPRGCCFELNTLSQNTVIITSACFYNFPFGSTELILLMSQWREFAALCGCMYVLVSLLLGSQRVNCFV